MHKPALFAWTGAPFLRLLPPLIVGILLPFDTFPITVPWLLLIIPAILLLFWSKFPITTRFQYRYITGIAINTMILGLGTLCTYYSDIRHQPHWYGHTSSQPTGFIVAINEPLSEKNATWKTTGTIQAIIFPDHHETVTGKLLMYFRKDSTFQQLVYGDRILFAQAFQPVKKAGNPGSFDYSAYCARQGIYHQVYLKNDEYSKLPQSNVTVKYSERLRGWIYQLRENILHILRQNIPDPRACGLAEALLIGYKDHLDQDLIQSYSATGVVHVIAISGLHLGLVYLLLTYCCQPFRRHSMARWLRPVLIIAGLWLFSLLAGASPSVLRSAVMFTGIALGDAWARTSSPYNSLAASAFLLLCYQPNWLWDTGFQLSYAAVLSIALFQKPIYDRLAVTHKLLDQIWKLVTGTLAAQILTLPITLYYFHQFPILFIVTNLIAIPLSGLILFGEIFLCLIAWLSPIASYTGHTLQWLIEGLNDLIEMFSRATWSVINNIQISVLQVWLLYGCIGAFAGWSLLRRKRMFIWGLAVLLGFVAINTFSYLQAAQQSRVVVYHVPHHQAVDFIQGSSYFFRGDTTLQGNPILHNFHLQPTRCLYRVHPTTNPDFLLTENNLVQFGSRSVLFLDSSFRWTGESVHTASPEKRITVDILIISHCSRINFRELHSLFNCKQVVIDGTIPAWKGSRWAEDCDQLDIPCQSTALQGAFVLNGY